MVPMMMILGYDPAVTQVAYRIGDSITNPLSPLFYYFPLILGFVRRYEKDTGMGTIIANMLPYSIAFTAAWITFLLAVWVILTCRWGRAAASICPSDFQRRRGFSACLCFKKGKYYGFCP